eukprot:2075830-Prymnesium_polylepis.1
MAHGLFRCCAGPSRSPELKDELFKGDAVWGDGDVSRPLRGCGGAFRHMRPHHYRVLVLLLLSDIARHLPGALRNANINFILPALHVRPRAAVF